MPKILQEQSNLIVFFYDRVQRFHNPRFDRDLSQKKDSTTQTRKFFRLKVESYATILGDFSGIHPGRT